MSELFYEGTVLLIGGAGRGKTQRAEELVSQYGAKGIVGEWHVMHGLACKYVHVTNSTPSASFLARFVDAGGTIEYM